MHEAAVKAADLVGGWATDMPLAVLPDIRAQTVQKSCQPHHPGSAQHAGHQQCMILHWTLLHLQGARALTIATSQATSKRKLDSVHMHSC